MKTPEILSSPNHRMLRNGKIVSSKKNMMIKKKSVLKMKNVNQLFFHKTIQKKFSTSHDKNKNNSREIVVTTAFDNLLGDRRLYVLLQELSWPVINNIKVKFGDQNYSNGKKNCYKNLEDHIQSNELQIYNDLEPKKERKSKLVVSTKTIETALPSKSLRKKNNINTETNSITNQNIDVRITRGKTIMRQIEERKQLNQMMLSKFPNSTFKMFVIELDDISEEAKFLRKLGLTCRFKCPLTTYKLKKKH